MPSKNTIKHYIPQYYYHVYNRGWNKTAIFLEESDYVYLEFLISRCLSPVPIKDSRGREYVRLEGQLQLNAYCIMPNHFHMLVYQQDELAMSKFVQSIFTAYTYYFNKKYKRRGPLFENRFKAVPIHSESHLQHITRYIHLNHWDYKRWPYSSYTDYLMPASSRDWVQPKPILGLFDSTQQYIRFVDGYAGMQRASEKQKREEAAEDYLYND